MRVSVAVDPSFYWVNERSRAGWGGGAFLLHVEKVGRKLVDYENMNTYLRSDPTTSSDPGIEDQSAADADDADDDMNKDT